MAALALCVWMYAVQMLHPGTLKAMKGVASWYGQRESGKTMANGHPFDPHKLTCASRFYPFGTKLRVTNLATHNSVVLVVTDRGPWITGRILDVSEAAAFALNMHAQGVATVKIEPLENQ